MLDMATFVSITQTGGNAVRWDARCVDHVRFEFFGWPP